MVANKDPGGFYGPLLRCCRRLLMLLVSLVVLRVLATIHNNNERPTNGRRRTE